MAGRLRIFLECKGDMDLFQEKLRADGAQRRCRVNRAGA